MTKARKLSVDEQKEIIPDEAIRKAFVERDDIVNLSEEEQERLWQEALENINGFRKWLADIPTFVLSEE